MDISKLTRFFQRKDRESHSNDSDGVDIEAELAIAREAWGAGERAHAVLHASRALLLSSVDPRVRAVLDMMVSSTPDPMSLLPKSEPRYAAEWLFRAWVLSATGDYGKAVDIVLQVLRKYPKYDSLQLAIDWLQIPVAINTIEVQDVKRFLHWIVTNAPELFADKQVRSELLDRLPAFVRRVRETQQVDMELLILAAMALRKAGHAGEAVDVSRAVYEATPNYDTATDLANSYRAVKDVDRAVEMYRAALGYDPDDLAARLDLGDVFFEAGDCAQALRWYEEVLRKEPEHDWALPSTYSAQYWLTGDNEWLSKLRYYAKANAKSRRAAMLASFECPYFGTRIPEPVDVTVNALRDISAKLNRLSPGDTYSATINYLDAPSPLRLLTETLEAEPISVKTVIKIRAIQKRDPREPHGDVEWVLWTYDGTDPSRNVPRPSRRIADLVAKIASTPYDYERWVDLAERAATEIPPDTEPELLGVMLYPAPAPPKSTSWDWLQRNQIAAALVIAGLPGSWDGSVRRRLLTSVVNGPLDWTVGAAAIGLATAAMADPAAEKDAVELLSGVIERAPEEAYVCYFVPALASILKLRGLGPDRRVEYVKLLFAELSNP